MFQVEDKVTNNIYAAIHIKTRTSMFSVSQSSVSPSSYFYPCSVTYDFDLKEFDIISENAQDFISQLLRLSPRNRLTAEECLDHPWLLEQDIG